MAHFKKRKDGSKRKIWNCYNKVKNGIPHEVNGEIIGCDNKDIGNDILESAVLQALNEISVDKKAIISKVTKIVTDVLRSKEREQYNFKRTEQAIERLEAKKLKNIDAYYDDLISRTDFKRLTEQYQAEIDSLNNELKAERDKIAVIENKNGFIDEICSVIKSLASFDVFDDSITKEVLDKIIVHSKYNIEVYLKGIKDSIFFTDKEKILDNKYRCQ